MTEQRTMKWTTALIAAAMIALMGLAVAAASAAENEAIRLDRKVRVMERVIDEVLVQSPNILVSPGGTVRGLVLEEYGALFTFEGNLDSEVMIRIPRAPRAPRAGRSVIVIPGDDDDDDEDDDDKSWEEMEKESREKANEMYEGLKVELMETLIDYGATLGELGNDRWVAIAAFLDSRQLLGSSDTGKRLLLKARMRDLRQYAAGSLSRDAAMAKIIIEEI
jgi:hypothetical protein